MPNFTWTNAAGGDWGDASNWSPRLGAPPGASDAAIFGSLASSYTVTVTTTVVDVEVGIISPGASGPTFSISGSLTTEDISYLGLSPTSMTVEPGGLLDITTTLEATGVTETITVGGDGAGGRLVLGNPLSVGAGGSNVTFHFANVSPTALNAGVIEIDNTSLLSSDPTTQTITDVANGDEFVLPDENFAARDTATLNPTTDVLTVKQGLVTVFTMNNVSLQTGAANSFAIVNGDTIQAVQMACHARGTMISTPAGERAVETLRPGMQVITLIDGPPVPRTIKWVGHRRIDLTRHPRSDTVAPIRVERDAFADNVPHRDLLVSPDHAVVFDGMLIPAKLLVNGASIAADPVCREVTYFHVELASHDILLAEGLAAESYLDTGNRHMFENAGPALVLHPDFGTGQQARVSRSCLPFADRPDQVEPVWRALVDRARTLGWAVPRPVVTDDPDLHVRVGTRRIDPVAVRDGRYTFVLPPGGAQVTLASRAARPSEARPWIADDRLLGAMVRRLAHRNGADMRDVAMDDPALREGWWAVESDAGWPCRWTTGDAILPALGAAVLEVELSAAMLYPAMHANPAAGAQPQLGRVA